MEGLGPPLTTGSELRGSHMAVLRNPYRMPEIETMLAAQKANALTVLNSPDSMIGHRDEHCWSLEIIKSPEYRGTMKSLGSSSDTW